MTVPNTSAASRPRGERRRRHHPRMREVGRSKAGIAHQGQTCMFMSRGKEGTFLEGVAGGSLRKTNPKVWLSLLTTATQGGSRHHKRQLRIQHHDVLIAGRRRRFKIVHILAKARALREAVRYNSRERTPQSRTRFNLESGGECFIRSRHEKRPAFTIATQEELA